MSVSEAASGVVYESVESTESAPDTAPCHGIGRDAARRSARAGAERRQISATVGSV